MIINNSYLIADELLATAEPGSMVFDPVSEQFYTISEPGVLTDIDPATLSVGVLAELVAAAEAGGVIEIVKPIDVPSALKVDKDMVIINNSTITAKEDTIGDGVFEVVNGTLTLNGKGTVNGLGKNDYCMAIWAAENGKVIINDGYFTNVGAHSEEDGEHFDLIYASGNGQVEINGGEFKCETPKWTVNIKDNSRETAKITIKGGKFHGFNPATSDIEGENTNFLAPGYKVVEETENVFVVIPE
jgi:hypothetical protein